MCSRSIEQKKNTQVETLPPIAKKQMCRHNSQINITNLNDFSETKLKPMAVNSMTRRRNQCNSSFEVTAARHGHLAKVNSCVSRDKLERDVSGLFQSMTKKIRSKSGKVHDVPFSMVIGDFRRKKIL